MIEAKENIQMERFLIDMQYYKISWYRSRERWSGMIIDNRFSTKYFITGLVF